MSFKTNTLHVVVSLDPNEGNRYNKTVKVDAWSLIIENIYNITGCKKDYVNTKTYGEMRWKSVRYYDTNTEDSMGRWHNKLYDLSTRRCIRIPKLVHWIGSNLCDLLRFDGACLIDTFLAWMEGLVHANQRIQTMDVVVNGTHLHWWEMHHTNI
jgi:hypothetical protein